MEKGHGTLDFSLPFDIDIYKRLRRLQTDWFVHAHVNSGLLMKSISVSLNENDSDQWSIHVSEESLPVISSFWTLIDSLG